MDERVRGSKTVKRMDKARSGEMGGSKCGRK